MINEQHKYKLILSGIYFGYPFKSIDYFINKFGQSDIGKNNRFNGSGFIEHPDNDMSMVETIKVINENSFCKIPFEWNEAATAGFLWKQENVSNVKDEEERKHLLFKLTYLHPVYYDCLKNMREREKVFNNFIKTFNKNVPRPEDITIKELLKEFKFLFPDIFEETIREREERKMNEDICKTCGNCDFINTPFTEKNKFQKCGRVGHEDINHHCDIKDISDDTIVFTADGENYESGLYVTKDYGCILFKQKQTQEKENVK